MRPRSLESLDLGPTALDVQIYRDHRKYGEFDAETAMNPEARLRQFGFIGKIIGRRSIQVLVPGQFRAVEADTAEDEGLDDTYGQRLLEITGEREGDRPHLVCLGVCHSPIGNIVLHAAEQHSDSHADVEHRNNGHESLAAELADPVHILEGMPRTGQNLPVDGVRPVIVVAVTDLVESAPDSDTDTGMNGARINENRQQHDRNNTR